MKTYKNAASMALILVLLLAGNNLLNAQPGQPTSPTPFGFLELLIGAGVFYGSKKVYETQNTKKGS